MLFPAPPPPAFAPDARTISQHALRYEDLAQDGRMMPIAMPHALDGLWRDVLSRHPGAQQSMAAGVLPILTRLTITSHARAIRVDRPIEARSGYQLAHVGTREQVDRIVMLLWTDVYGTELRRGSAEGELVHAGSLFAEHTFTRPFAPPDRRKVTRLEVDGYPDVPETAYAMPRPASGGERPVGTRWVDELDADPTETVLGLDHTDGNQHVNSLVYLRLFLDAVWRRVGASGRRVELRSRAVDIAYRKPSFAGDRVRVRLQLFEGPDGLGAAGYLAADDGRPRCYVRAALSD